MTDLHLVILAAGKGTRMKSALPKVLHPMAGRPIIEHVLGTAAALGAADTTVVIGHEGDQVRAALAAHRDLSFVTQSPQLGTGHAVLVTEPILGGRRGTMLLLYADVPLLSRETLERLLERHRTTRAAATVLTADVPDPRGYGRVVRDAEGSIARIVEERDASTEDRAIREVNSGIYAFELDRLFESLHGLATDNAQGEYYLTDLVAMYRRAGRPVETLRLQDALELRGVNTRVDLADLGREIRRRTCRSLMLDGVTIEDPETTYIDEGVRVGADTVIAPGVSISGTTTIGARCRIHAGVRITDSVIADEVTILDRSVIAKSTVGARASIGPFAHLRPESEIGEDARVGNFVELKKTRLGRRSKASHLSYLGDALIGEDVNVGAGTITCNYDGVNKHATVIERGVFVGSDSQLVAPVTVGEGAYVAAGSTITEDVPAGALAIARTRQVTKGGWAARRPGKKKESH